MTDKEHTDSNLLEDQLSIWAVVMKLGLVEDGEVYDDHGYDKYPKNDKKKKDLKMRYPKIILIQKLYKSDLTDYIAIHKSSHNMFRMDINTNMGQFMAEIVPKLKKLHDNGLIHGDLKPENLVVDYEDCQDGTTEFKSFGIIDWEEIAEINGFKNRMIGTRGYVAPEIKDNDDWFRITPQLDVFSLGISLLQLLNDGVHPYKNHINSDDDPQELLNQDMLDEIFDECVIYENFMFNDLVENMISYDANQRYDINDVINHSWFQENCTIKNMKRN